LKVRRILEVGDVFTLAVTANYDLCFQNDVGGTESAPLGLYRIRVDKVWHDYETGYRATGTLASKAQIEKLRKQGTTPHQPKIENWRPEFVMFAGELTR